MILIGTNGQKIGGNRLTALLEHYRKTSAPPIVEDAALFRSMNGKDQQELLFYMVTTAMMGITDIQRAIAEYEEPSASTSDERAAADWAHSREPN